MTQNLGTIVIAPITTPDSADTYPTHLANLGFGGLHNVATYADRDAIPVERRAEGMIVTIAQDGSLYKLTNGAWIVFTAQAAKFTFQQSVASTVWTINHPLNGYPTVVVQDSAGSVVLGDVDYDGPSRVILRFGFPFSGFAYLS